MTKSKKLNSKGFTLIELLIVIIIIGILAAIAFVAYSGAQNKAKKSDAQSTVATAKEKLGEYNADKGYYPASKTVFVTWLQSDDGGKNTNFTASDKFGDANYTYTAAPTGCDNATNGDCTSYTLTASKALWGGGSSDSDLSVSN